MLAQHRINAVWMDQVVIGMHDVLSLGALQRELQPTIAATTEGLEMSLLGGVTLRLRGEPLTGLVSRRAVALLIYLVCTGRPHSRETLANLLWDEGEQSRLLGNLRVLLSSLRQSLGAHLIITRQTVAFNPASSHWLDVATLEAGLAVARLQSDRLLPAAAEHLAQTLALYQGDFLHGFHLRGSQGFEEWQMMERERLRLRIIEALDNLITVYLTQGEYTAGLAQAQRLVQFDPLRENTYSQLMRLFAANGQRTAALAQYEVCCQILASHLGVAPLPETTALYEQIRAGILSLEHPGPADIAREYGRELIPRPLARPASESAYRDWGDAPDIMAFYGRQAELARMEQWLIAERCRLVAVVGMGGLGKTTLAAQVARSLADQFDCVFWRSLLNAPPLAEVLRACLECLSQHTLTDLPTSLDAQLALLFDALRRRRCLLVLDNVESIMQHERAGYYQPGYADYDQLIRRVATSDHQSCLLLTSREMPQRLVHLAGDSLKVQTLQLGGVTGETGQAILQAYGLAVPLEPGVALVARYSGNPLALKLAARTVQEIFGGDITAVLSDTMPIFDDIRDVLEQQFARLSPLERDILVWLAIEREAVSYRVLAENLRASIAKRTLLEAVRALQRRSLLEKVGDGFTLQDVVTEYLTDYLIEQVCLEIERHGTIAERREMHGNSGKSGGVWGEVSSYASPENTTMFSGDALPAKSSVSPVFWYLNRFALLKAEAQEQVRQNQIRCILHPIAERLMAHLGPIRLEARLRQLLVHLQTVAPLVPGYAAHNILNLLLHLEMDGQAYDCSHLATWQASLREVRLPEVTFAGASLQG